MFFPQLFCFGRNSFFALLKLFKMEKRKPRVLIVGCGLTGSVVASMLKHEASADVCIWEKEFRTGGRFYTFSTSSDPPCSVDLGAQYVSASLEFIRSHARFYDELLDKKKLVPLGEKIENFRRLSESKLNFVAPKGMSSLVDYFLEDSDAKISTGNEVVELNINPDKKNLTVKTNREKIEEFDAVILTTPVPEVLKIKGNFQNMCLDEDTRMQMEQVKFSSRQALAMMYSGKETYFDKLPWAMKYITDNESICFIAVDNRKRGANNDLPSVLVHTTTKFSQKCCDLSEADAAKMIIDDSQSFLPNVPEPSSIKIVNWTNSQITDPYIDSPGCIVLNGTPCLISGGDSFTESNFNGCITSALKIVEELLKHVAIAKIHKKVTK